MSEGIAEATIDLDAIPSELIRLDQWGVWKLEIRDGETTKVPKRADGRGNAKSNKPETWCGFDEAVGAYRTGKYMGIAFFFAEDDPFCGVDFDACHDPATGKLTDWAAGWVDNLDSYTEVSPSGYGVKMIVRATLRPKPKGWSGPWSVHKSKDLQTYGDKKPEIAMYDRTRFWCMTGQVYDGRAAIEERQTEMDALHEMLFEMGESPKPKDLDSMAAQCAIPSGDRSKGEYNLCCEAHRQGWPKEDVWRKVQGVGKFSASGRSYFETTWGNAESDVSAQRSRWNGKVSSEEAVSFWDAEGRTESANAQRLVALHGHDLRWCEPWKRWLVWDGKRWAVDQQRTVDRLARGVASGLWAEVAAAGQKDAERKLINAMMQCAKASSQANGIKNMIALARSVPGVAVMPDVLDTDPMLLNVDNGTLDLRTGDLQSHRREDHLTKLAPVVYDEKAEATRWLKFLDEVFEGKADLIRFVQRAAGYSLTGMTSERCLFFLYGPTGNNGKTTLVSLLQTMLGDYATTITNDMLMSSKWKSHPTEVADLFGARLVVASEVEDDRRLAESFIKTITGGEDTLPARRMREDFWRFKPTHKLWMFGNHKPRVSGRDDAIWTRIRLVPFDVRFNEPDKGLARTLEAELPGILAWAVRGCLDWHKADGLGEPIEVTAATKTYRREEDVIARFIEECCIVGPDEMTMARGLYRAYKFWCAESGEQTPDEMMSETMFGREMAALQDSMPIKGRNTKKGKLYQGLRAKSHIERPTYMMAEALEG